MQDSTIVVIGCGVVGLSTAYHLALRKPGRVVLLDKGPIGDGASSRAAGITTGLLWTETGVRARIEGLELFRQLSEELDGYTYHDEHGCLNLFEPEAWREREKLLPLYDRVNFPYEILSAEEVRSRWPTLRVPEDHVGLLDPQGGYSEPSEYLPALANRVRELGVEIHEHQPVTEFLTANGSIAGVRTPAQSIEADAVVSTVHVWSLPLWRDLGLRLPMKSFVHQRYVSAPLVESFVSPPVNGNGDAYEGYFRPASGNRLLLGVETPDAEFRVDSRDFRMTELTPPRGIREEPRIREEGVNRFRKILPFLDEVTWESEHVGLLSFSLDQEPILGPVDDVPGLFVACTLHSGGFSYNTVVGKLLAEYVTGVPTCVDVSAFLPRRFSGREKDVEAYLDDGGSESAPTRRH